tara:strand:- start:2399 stop:2611 length:213 start_codon:yes stop_codon:yes gene_type:complete
VIIRLKNWNLLSPLPLVVAISNASLTFAAALLPWVTTVKSPALDHSSQFHAWVNGSGSLKIALVFKICQS